MLGLTDVGVHVILSLIGIAAGLVVLVGMLRGKRLGAWTALFLVTTVLTCITGFFLPHGHLLPSDIVGIISLVVLAAAVVAFYVARLAGAWRWIFAISATLALYLNVFVGIVQAFDKFPVLTRLAPTQAEPPFLVAQLVVVALFGVLAFLAVKRFRPPAPPRGSVR